jgi:hypothetical protein
VPVRSDTVRRTLSTGERVEHTKPTYLCDCGAEAHFGFNVTINNRRKRLWYCAAHKQEGEMQIAEHG